MRWALVVVFFNSCLRNLIKGKDEQERNTELSSLERDIRISVGSDS